jgi:hypothetical protein
MSVPDQLENVVHEGIHKLDILDGRIPEYPAQGTHEQQLYAELRAHVGAAEFGARNDLNAKYQGLTVWDMAQELAGDYGYHSLDDPTFNGVVQRVASEFPGYASAFGVGIPPPRVK